MGRQLDRKWTDEQRDTVVRAVVIDGLSMAAAGKLVQDADGKPMPRETVKWCRDRIGDRFILRDAGAAVARLEQLRLECARQLAELAVQSLAAGKQTAEQKRRQDTLDRVSASLSKQIAALGPPRSARKPEKPEPPTNGHATDDAAVAAILAGG